MADSGGPGAMDLRDSVIGPPPDHIIETEVKGDVSLYDPRTEQVLILNSTASDVWLLCDGEQTVDEIVELVAVAYGRVPATIRDDIETTIRLFIKEGFLSPP